MPANDHHRSRQASYGERLADGTYLLGHRTAGMQEHAALGVLVRLGADLVKADLLEDCDTGVVADLDEGA